MTAATFVPEAGDLDELSQAARRCRGCPLWRTATQAVFGEGPAEAGIVLVGEQPGDFEDRQGRPFVGPAGKLLDKALAEAEIERDTVYLTNAVKHFKWSGTGGGGRRLHAKPNRREVVACLPWLEAELALVRPAKIGLLGSTAAQALLGPTFQVTKRRGEPILGDRHAPVVMATVHPSSVLRAFSESDRHQAFTGLVRDLRALKAA